MFRKRLIVSLIATSALVALPAFSQSEEPSRNDVSVQAFGSFLKSTTESGVQNSATNSGGVLGSYRFFFNRHSGVEANYGYALNTQNFVTTSGTVGVKSYSHEISGKHTYFRDSR